MNCHDRVLHTVELSWSHEIWPWHLPPPILIWFLAFSGITVDVVFSCKIYVCSYCSESALNLLQEFPQSFLQFLRGQWWASSACQHLTCLHCTPTWIWSLNVQISLGKFLVSKYHPCSQTDTTFFHCRCSNLMFQHLQIYDAVYYPISPTLPLNWPDAMYRIPQDALLPLSSECKLYFLICSLTNWSLWTCVCHSNSIFQQGK